MSFILSALVLSSALPITLQTSEDEYRAGVEARLSGDPTAAVERLIRVTAAQPDNSDAHLQLGLSLLAAGRLDEAEAAFRRTLEIAPDYADARIGLARVWERRGRRDAALAELEQVTDFNAEAEALAARLRAIPAKASMPRWQIDTDGAYSGVQGSEDWQEAVFAIRHQATATTSIAASLETAWRFGRNDVYGEARVDRHFSRNVNGYLLVGATPHASFRPQWQIGAGGSVRLHSGSHATIGRIDLRQAAFPAGDVRTVTPGIEQYLLGARAWITAQWINVFDKQSGRRRAGWLARGDGLVTDQLRVFAGLADAPDVSEGRVIQTFSLFGGVSLKASDRHTLRISLAREDRSSGADRTTVSVGLGTRF